jgi:hypothetical protein
MGDDPVLEPPVMQCSPAVAFLAFLFAALPLTAQEATRPKKLIEWGWDEPDTKFIRENIRKMEQFPFDGLVFHVNSSRGGNFTWELWGGRKFERDEFQHAVEDLRATEFRRFTDRFLRVNVTPGNVDWFDDQAWKTVLHNVGVAADIARQGGCRGFMFDVEQYERRLFEYSQQKPRPFAEYQAKVRQRGREWIQEVNGRFPQITILLTFGYAITRPPEGEDRFQAPYGLLADFLDGVLEDCSEETVVVDAWEQSYAYKRPDQFQEARRTITQKARDWTAVPEKYTGHVRAGFGLWMDYNWRKYGWDTEDVKNNYFSPEEFEAAVHSALAASDRYVWIYTEQPRWWTNDKLPEAYVKALERASSAAAK